MKSHKNLGYKISKLESDQATMIGRLTSNPVYEIPWLTESLYTTSLTLDYLRAAVKDITDGTETTTVYEHYIKTASNFLGRRYNVVESSSSIVHRESSIWKYQTMFEIQEIFSYLLSIENE